MKVAIRTDASSTVASGHVMRCKALADRLRERGAAVRFVCREHPGHLVPLLIAAGYTVAAVPPGDVAQGQDADDTLSALSGFAPDWTIVDHYAFDEQWEARLRPHVGRIAVIDDLANRRHDCDVLVDQNWFGEQTPSRYAGLVNGAVCLLGPQYALLQADFARTRADLAARDGVIRRLLVFFGAVDAAGQTATVLRALGAPDLRDIAVDVVVGHANPAAAEIERLAAAHPAATLHRQLPTLAPLMARADLMLGAGGTTTLERCCLGLPAIVVVAAENQRGSSMALADRGVHLVLGDASRIGSTEWADAVRDLRRTPRRVAAYSTAALDVTDGLGAQRVAAMLMDTAGRHHG